MWALLFDRRSVAWRPWALGTAMAGWPLVAWIREVLSRARAHPPSPVSDVPWIREALLHVGAHPPPGSDVPWIRELLFHAGVEPPRVVDPFRWLDLKFFRFWILDCFGFGLDFTLGDKFREFLASPIVGARPTYLMLAAHVLLVALAVSLLLPALRREIRERPTARQVFTGRGSWTALTAAAAFWGYGGLLTLTALPIHRHYLIEPYVLKFLWITVLALWGAGVRPDRRRVRGLLLALCVAQAITTVGLLRFIHVTQVIPMDYGPTWQSQQRP